jgi:hypothetical protein
MATKFFEELGVVETQTHVVVMTPGGLAFEGLTFWQIQAYLRFSDGGYLKVVTEWICPKCGQVHGDQLDLTSACES